MRHAPRTLSRSKSLSRRSYQPRVDVLEDRAAPGSLLSILDLPPLGADLCSGTDAADLGDVYQVHWKADHEWNTSAANEARPAAVDWTTASSQLVTLSTSTNDRQDLSDNDMILNLLSTDAQPHRPAHVSSGSPNDVMPEKSPVGDTNPLAVATVAVPSGVAGYYSDVTRANGNFGVGLPGASHESSGVTAGTSNQVTNPADVGGTAADAAPSGVVARSEAPPPTGDAEAEQIRALLRTGNAYQPGEPGAEEQLERQVQDILRSRNASAIASVGGPGAVAFSSAPDPATPGPLGVTVEEYNFGNTALDPVSIAGTGRVELTAQVIAPTVLTGQRPVLVFMHGNHQATYIPGTSSAQFIWPPNPGFVGLPNYRGYEYVASNLASHGYVVVSISVNGTNVLGGTNMVPRAEIMHRHLEVLANLNTGTGTVTPKPGETLTGSLTPFGARYVGHLDLTNIGTMGHSRGGDGVVAHYQYETGVSLAPLPVLPVAERFPIKAVLPLAPVDFAARTINNVPLLVMLPYNDGDVSNLQGQGFHDRARYNVPGDTAPKYVITVRGANHNSYNTVWFASGPPASGFSTTPPETITAGAGDEGAGAPRITAAEQRSTALGYFGAFFRLYVGNAAQPTQPQFFSTLTGDSLPPASVLPGARDSISWQYHAADASSARRDVNRILTPANLTTNTLGGAVTQSGLTPYTIANHGSTPTSAAGTGIPTIQVLRAGWTSATAFWQNDLPAGSRDVSNYYALQVRAAVDFADARNLAGLPQDFQIALTDGAGNTATTTVAAAYAGRPDPLYFPPQNRHRVENTVRLPLSLFGGVNLTDVRSIRFNFNQTASGALWFADLAFADPANTYAGPFVVAITERIVPGSTSIAVKFGGAINPATFQASDVKLVAPNGTTFAASGVTVVPGSGNSQFNVNFPSVSQLGSYLVNIGPDVRDAAGNQMDQDFDGTTGEPVHDVFDSRFQVVRLVDDGDAGFATTGLDWTSFPGQGFANDVTFSAAGTGADQATWTFSGLPTGQYRVALTWSIHPNRATNAPFAVFDGTTAGTLRGSFVVNQEILPNDYLVADTPFEYLPGSFLINSGTLTVRLTDQANEFVIADAVIVERAPLEQVVDDGDAGFSSTPGFVHWTPADTPVQGFQDDVHYASPGEGSEFALWSYTGLTPGDTFTVSLTWSIHPNRATDAAFFVLDENFNTLAFVIVNQELAPDDYVLNNVAWEILGNVTVPAGTSTLHVFLHDLANEFVIADAARLQRV